MNGAFAFWTWNDAPLPPPNGDPGESSHMPLYCFFEKLILQIDLSFYKLRKFCLNLIRPVAPYLAFPLAWLICSSVREKIINGDNEGKLLKRGGPIIYAFWHGRLLYLMHRYRGGDHLILVSQSRDGDLISSAARLFGFRPIRGSTSKSGGTAIRQLIRLIKAGKNCGIAPDGPRGPRYKAQPGAIALASITGAPIFPLTYSARRGLFAGSWDRFLLPAPFTEVVLVYGRPIEVARGSGLDDLENKRLELERELNLITTAADEYFDKDRGKFSYEI